MKRSKKEKRLLIAKEDFRKIMGDDWEFFQEIIVHNCLCHHCGYGYEATIVDYEVEINDLDDTLLKGKCAKCGYPVNRYLETGEDERQVMVIEDIRRRYAKN